MKTESRRAVTGPLSPSSANLCGRIAADLLQLPLELAPVVAIDGLGGARLLRGA